MSCRTIPAYLFCAAILALPASAHAQDTGIMGFTPGQSVEEALSIAKSLNLNCRSWDKMAPKVCVDPATGKQVTFYFTWAIRPRVIRELQLSFQSNDKPNEVADALSKQYQVDYSVIGFYRSFEWKLGKTTKLSLVKNLGTEYMLDLTDDEIKQKDQGTGKNGR
jgi:hypothetical protein